MQRLSEDKSIIIDNPDKKYELSSCDPLWKDHFSIYKYYIEELFGDDAVGIEHIGSTSVPAMLAKPVIDVLVVVMDISLVEHFRSQFVRDFFEVHFERYIARSYQIRKMHNGKRVANIHVFPVGHPYLHVMISERDYWLQFPESAKEYSNTKQKIFDQCGDDYKKYLFLKKEYLDSIEPVILQWYEASGQKSLYRKYE
ncbi:MAG: GrpB-like predicted nucleotidyltransferase (UPF0157 family) [Planctomycetota bacterium]|jgi:GrpB-like predicted nucleotidyltransferase (UPF0157 family)